MSLEGKRVVLGVSGGIAAYKVADLASKLTQAGALVDVIMTAAAQKFVTPMTFSALTHRPVRTDLFESWLGDDTGHVALAHDASILVVAPATAHTIANLCDIHSMSTGTIPSLPDQFRPRSSGQYFPKQLHHASSLQEF